MTKNTSFKNPTLLTGKFFFVNMSNAIIKNKIKKRMNKF